MEQVEIPEDMKRALALFNNTADEIIKSFCNGLESKPPPEIIYHYTDDKGLKSILETGQFWLSDIFYLNDPSELSHGFSHAVKILNRLAENGPPESQTFARHLADFHQHGMQGSAHYFVCAFSSRGNDLGQWRAYADNGRGFALGFDAKALEQTFVKKTDNTPISENCTFPVTYNDAILVDIHQKLIDKMFHLISLPKGRGLNAKVINAYMRDLSVTLSVHVLRSALFFKHPAYDNEEEYRFLQINRGDIPPPKEVKQRYRPYELIKYKEFDWKHLARAALKKIVIGPAADQLKAFEFARSCLAIFHGEEIEITCSEIPYRAR